jgi:hypothetical protein
MVHFATQPEGTAEDRVRRVRPDRGRLGSVAIAAVTRTRPNDPWRVVFPSKRPAGSTSRPRDVCAHDSHSD